MMKRTTAREVVWMLTGMVLLFNCGCCIAYLLGIGAFFWVGCVFGAVGFGIGYGVGMHLDYMRWNLKKSLELDEAAKQLLNKYLLREIFVIIGIWVISPAMNMATFVLIIALSGDSL